MLRSKLGAALLVVAAALPIAARSTAQSTSPDDALRHHVVARLVAHAGAAHVARLEVHVAGGVVTVRGALPKERRDLAAVLASIPGVRFIDDRTTVSDPAVAPAATCPPGTIAYRNGNETTVHCVPAPPCGPQQARNANGQCECPPGTVAYRSGNETTVRCVATPPCGPQQTRAANGQCVCPPGTVGYRNGNDPSGTTRCVAAPPCGPQQTRNASGQCVCPPGTVGYREGSDGSGTTRCVPATPPR